MRILTWLPMCARLVFLAGALAIPAARAEVAVKIEEFSGEVVVSFSGTLKIAGYPEISLDPGGGMNPSGGFLVFSNPGGAPAGTFDIVAGNPYTNNPGPFGTGPLKLATAFTGDYLALSNVELGYAKTYVSETPFSGSLIFAGESLASLGINPDLPSYEWLLNNGDRIQLRVLSLAAKTERLAILRAKLARLKKALRKALGSGRGSKARLLKRKIRKLSREIAAS